MADLRSKYMEDYAGGLLNVSRQELSSTGEVLSQDGLLSNSTLFVEDGTGTKSGLLLGNSLCEVVDPTTEKGAVNVRYADRTYASIRDLKIFSTAIASAQAALSDAASSSITNLENAFELLEDAFDTLQNSFDTREAVVDSKLERLSELDTLTDSIANFTSEQESIVNRIDAVESKSNANSKAFSSIGNINTVSFLDYGEVTSLVVETPGSDVRTAGEYTLTGLISTNGSGLELTATVATDTGVVTVAVTNGGTNFLVGDKITIADSSLGSGGADNVVLRVETVKTSMTTDKLAAQVSKLFGKVNEIIEAFT